MNTRLSFGMRSVSAITSLLLAAPLALAQQSAPPPPAGDQNMPQQGAPGYGMHGRRPGPGGEHGDRMRMRDENSGMDEALFSDTDDMADLDFGPAELPPDDWWKRPSVAARLSLSADQIKRLDDLWLQSRLTDVQMNAQIEEQELRLEPILSEPTVDQAKAQAALDKLAETRAALEKAQGKVMLSMRAVLTADQWNKLHAPRPMGEYRPGGMPGSTANSGAMPPLPAQ